MKAVTLFGALSLGIALCFSSLVQTAHAGEIIIAVPEPGNGQPANGKPVVVVNGQQINANVDVKNLENIKANLERGGQRVKIIPLRPATPTGPGSFAPEPTAGDPASAPGGLILRIAGGLVILAELEYLEGQIKDIIIHSQIAQAEVERAGGLNQAVVDGTNPGGLTRADLDSQDARNTDEAVAACNERQWLIHWSPYCYIDYLF